MRKLIVALILCPVMSSCGIVKPSIRSESKMNRLAIDMPRQEVLMSMGAPDAVRGSRKNEDGTVLQVDEYRLYSPNAPVVNFFFGILMLTIPWWTPLQPPTYYWVSYVDGKVEKWGRAGDWQPKFTADVTHRYK